MGIIGKDVGVYGGDTDRWSSVDYLQLAYVKLNPLLGNRVEPPTEVLMDSKLTLPSVQPTRSLWSHNSVVVPGVFKPRIL